MPSKARATLVAAVLAASAAAATAASAAPQIHAHRGGTVTAGKPTYTEESLDAYRNAAKHGFVFEVDAKLTADRVPVAIHDATLDRTTNCTGEVRSFTLAALKPCRPDVLGSPGGGLRTKTIAPRGSIATVADVLELARLTGSKVNLEIKNLPTDPDWDPTYAYADEVMDVVKAAGLKRSQLLIQSFIPGNLDAAKRNLKGVQTSLLTLPATSNEVTIARDKGYTWLSPQWPFTAAFVREAHRAHKRVAPYTINTSADVTAAAGAKVDALITDDPLMAAAALGLRPPKGLKARFRHERGGVVASGRLQLPPGVPKRKGCKGGAITLRVLGARQAVRQASVRMERDCTYFVALPLPRKWPAHPRATIGFGGNGVLLAHLNGPRPLP
jgi:glycerophosphoryl diester phosphodiesterase